MIRAKFLMAGLAMVFGATLAPAEQMRIMIEDAYARSSNPKVAAAFMDLVNHSQPDDRLVGGSSDAAKRVELHTHIEEDGIMKMVHVEEGFSIAAGGTTQLERGGMHVMLMGLNAPLEQGDTLTVTLTFEQAGDVTLDIPVDNTRKDSGHGGNGHADHEGHGN